MSIFLVVDDSDVDRMMFKSFIERVSGYSVVEAENGMDALEKVSTWNPDVVVTDLQMPKMDGLDLVKQLRLDYPKIPVVLATGHGSNEIANRALECGAAGYVPKSQLSDLLVPTLRNIVSRKQYEESFLQLMDRSKKLSTEFVLENDRELFPPLIGFCKNLIEGSANLEYIDVMRIGIAIEQALHNALYRGNMEIPSTVSVPFGDEIPSDDLRRRIKDIQDNAALQNRKIHVDIDVNPHEFVCKITDEGKGFDPEAFEDVETTQPGRGLLLMKTFVESVDYNDKGNQVTLRHSYDAKHPELVEGNGAVTDEKKILGTLMSMSTGTKVQLRRRKLVVGSSRSSHIALNGHDISDHHCLLVHKKDRWYVKDMGSVTGTFVNDAKVERSKLNPGDVLRVGDRKLKIDF